jgi:Sulfatase
MVNRLEIVKEKWDHLIVLDACRYDYFEQVYEKYIHGTLLKKESIGSCTNEWRDESFPGYYDDIVYISANPQISSKTSVYGYTAGEHFGDVYELWRDNWDASWGTVLPDKVTERALEIIGKTSSSKRVIIHYLQPHAPYIGASFAPKGYAKADIATERTLIGIGKTTPSAFKSKLYEYLLKIFTNNKLLTNRPDWVLRKLLGIPPVAPMEIALRALGKQKLRQAYKANLKLVLEQVAVLIENLSGRIVVTSDHGEFLGEHGCYSHPKGWTDPILVEVPWLIIDKSEKNTTEESGSREKPLPQDVNPQDKLNQQPEDEMVIERLRSLGYYE